ncbi:EAL domain-containing response regulator [Amphritea sp. HPY]|uniref:EAL domain-containing response regulator n=1 Tax=Amphritea sp. HPY TaxID=3421652 RepID=UPI003D7D5385
MLNKIHILLLDDDPLQLKLLTWQLKNLGCDQIVGFNSASKALAALEDTEPVIDLIFLDLKMPDMDGVEVLRQLSHILYTGALVLFTGEDQDIMEATARLATAHKLNLLGALSKPCGHDELYALLDRYQRSKRSANGNGKKTYTSDEIRCGIDQGEFVNVYQPKVKLVDGTLADVETLVRWHHPYDGLVYPDQFITVAEEHSLIQRLTRSVLAEGLIQMKCWRDAGLQCGVSFNVSMLDLTDLAFPEYVLGELQRNDVSTTNLTLEVTESRLIMDFRASMEILLRLRLMGVRLSIDDFGTGHSSLAQLRDLPFTELKLDRSFVDGVHNDSTLGAIVEASGDMAQHLNMMVVAEGVESLEDWRWLRERNCDLAQGYLIAKPMPGEELAGWLENWEARKQELLAD